MPSPLPPPLSSLAAWIGVPAASLDADPRAEAVLAAASNLVQGYTGKDWTTDAPADVIGVVVQAAARVYLSPANPNVKNWGGGTFSEGYFDAAQNGLYLTDSEYAVLNRYKAGVQNIGTIGTTRGESSGDTVYVPTGPPPSGYPFPWYAADGF